MRRTEIIHFHLLISHSNTYGTFVGMSVNRFFFASFPHFFVAKQRKRNEEDPAKIRTKYHLKHFRSNFPLKYLLQNSCSFLAGPWGSGERAIKPQEGLQ